MLGRVFLKLCTYLQSRLPSIRLAARETMQNILLEVGPSYLPQLLSEMMSILTRGFQVHVLVFTSHAVLEKLQSTFTKGVIDPCVDDILKVNTWDCFLVNFRLFLLIFRIRSVNIPHFLEA